MLAVAKAVDGGAGLPFIVKNYEGDVTNFDMAGYSITLSRLDDELMRL